MWSWQPHYLGPANDYPGDHGWIWRSLSCCDMADAAHIHGRHVPGECPALRPTPLLYHWAFLSDLGSGVSRIRTWTRAARASRLAMAGGLSLDRSVCTHVRARVALWKISEPSPNNLVPGAQRE